VDPIDLELVSHLPIYEVLKEYCRVNRTNIQDVDTLDNYYRVISKLKECLEESDLKTAGPLIHLGSILLKIESEKLILKYLDEDQQMSFLMERGVIYRMDVELALQEAMLSMLSRSKDKIVIEKPGEIGGELFGIDVDELNRRRDTDDEDLKNILDDDEEYETIRMVRITGEHLRRESISNTMMEDFDLDRLMEEFRQHISGKDGIELQDIGMEYLDAFVASLHLASMEEITLIQENIGDPIIVHVV